MSNFEKVANAATYLVAIFTWFMFASLFNGISSFGSTDRISISSLIYNVVLALCLQLGLFIAPFAKGKALLLRIITMGLMMPFIYFFVLHDLFALVAGILDSPQRFFDIENRFSTLFLVTVWVVTYGYNILALCFVRDHKSDLK